MSVEQKQKDVRNSLYFYLEVRNCYTCSYYNENENKCYNRHVHTPKLNCNEHKFSNS